MMQFPHIMIFVAIGCLQLQCIDCTEGKDNKGRNFILGFMDNIHKGVLEVFITTDHLGEVVVNITTPLFNPSYFQTLTVRNKEVKKVNFNHSIGGVGTEISNKGIYVQSDNEITLYAVNKASATTDAFVVFPVDTLGDEYYVITWNERSQFMIIATEDNTEVTITVGRSGTSIIFSGQVYSSGMSLTFTMNKFQTFHAFGGTTSDYSGTYITSSKVIAVFSGSQCNQIGSGACDHLISQMTPVETFGNNFVTINMASCSSPVNFKIVVSENDTHVYISGKSNVSLPNSGDIYSFSTTSLTPTVVVTDKPAALAFFSQGGCGIVSGDPAMILLPPIQQFAADYTFSTVEFPDDPFTSSLTIVIAESEISGLLLDRKNITSENWRPIIGSNTLRITNILITEGSHTIYHTNPTITFLAVSTGVGNANSYGYSAGQRLAPINNNCSISVPVPGDIIDNDCDGLIDEELRDGIDNDGDGEIDEDLAKPFEELSTTTTTSNTKEIVGDNLSTYMVIAGVLSSLFAISCLSTAVYFLKRKLKGKSGQVEDVFSSISSNNVPPVHNAVHKKA